MFVFKLSVPRTIAIANIFHSQSVSLCRVVDRLAAAAARASQPAPSLVPGCVDAAVAAEQQSAQRFPLGGGGGGVG